MIWASVLLTTSKTATRLERARGCTVTGGAQGQPVFSSPPALQRRAGALSTCVSTSRTSFRPLSQRTTQMTQTDVAAILLQVPADVKETTAEGCSPVRGRAHHPGSWSMCRIVACNRLTFKRTHALFTAASRMVFRETVRHPSRTVARRAVLHWSPARPAHTHTAP